MPNVIGLSVLGSVLWSSD